MTAPVEPVIEKELVLPGISVQLATVNLSEARDAAPHATGYSICQRLSDDHAPLRIGNVNAREAFPRVGSVGFLPPGCTVRLYAMGASFRVLNCTFEAEEFERITGFGHEIWEQHTGALVSIKDRRLELLMQEIHAELVQPDYGQETVIEAAGRMILIEMARYGRRLAAAGGTNQGLAPWQLRRINERLAAALDLGYPALDELAALCGISQSHLMRSFKAATGWPIHKYVSEERMRVARQLLADGGYNAQEIAGRLGFRSAAYFATAFRRMSGQTPTEFRRAARAQQRD